MKLLGGTGTHGHNHAHTPDSSYRITNDEEVGRVLVWSFEEEVHSSHTQQGPETKTRNSTGPRFKYGGMGAEQSIGANGLRAQGQYKGGAKDSSQ